MATQATYCTERDLKDIFPEVDSFDTKTPIYGWVSLGNSLYRANNAGLVTKLFKDGKELAGGLTESVATYADAGVNTNETFLVGDTTLTLESSGGADNDIVVGQVISLGANGATGTEKMLIIAESTDDLTVIRGLFETSQEQHSTGKDVYIAGGILLDYANEWTYDKYSDSIFMYSSSDPNDSLMESGEDWATLKDRYMKNASEYLDSRLDGTLPRQRFKDQDGNYDYIIVRTSALISAVFLIRSHDPTSEVASALWDEATDSIDKINKGETKLSWQVTQSDSQGTVREVSVSGALRIVDTRGHYVGVYDRIKVKVITGGAIGTSTYSVWTSGSDKLGIHEGAQVVTAKTINGDYQSLEGGLQIRFAGDKTDEATADDEWEVEVTGKYEAVDNARPKTIKMTRRGTPQAFRWQ